MMRTDYLERNLKDKVMKYKSVIVTKRGGPEVMQIIENELRPPATGEARIKVLATAVGRTDINYRYGYSPFSPKVPFRAGIRDRRRGGGNRRRRHPGRRG